VNCLASEFLEVCCASHDVDVIHYIGSNQHVLSVFDAAFTAGKVCLVDGQGNGLLYADDTFPVAEAARVIVRGATRFNGETCTSVNGVLAHRAVYAELRAAIVSEMSKLRVGDPTRADVEIGPLFSEKQAAGLRRTIAETAGARVLCGGEVRGAYFTPAVIEGVEPGQQIAREGFFGPVVWVAPVQPEEVGDWLRENRFPLSDTVLSASREAIAAFARASHAARICVNADPSVESMFEPWGGYPPSGLNPVSVWTEKYRQTFQLDGGLKEIMAVLSDSSAGFAGSR
jgi:acyl-CoA reductase-like NAD-dependent aldehyde dehydrogenase